MYTLNHSSNSKREKKLKRVFIVYLLVLIWFLFINVGSVNRNTYFRESEVHLIPFENTYTCFTNIINNIYGMNANQVPYYWFMYVRNIVGNIALFVPLGFLLPSLFAGFRSVKYIAILALLLSLLAEILQYIFTIGVFDVDDIIYNTVGSIIGFYLFKHFNKA